MFLLLLLVATAASPAFSSPSTDRSKLLGGRRCSWGPAYWCQSLRQSAECSATRHCLTNYWPESRPEPDGDDVCSICKEMVKEARDTLRSNETEIELKQVFDGTCSLIPIRPIADECKKLSDDFIVQLVETLSSELNPQVVCAVAGLCNNARVDNMLLEYYLNSSECDVCKAESAKVAHKIQRMAKNDVVDKLLQLCGYAGSYSDACKATVLDNFEVIYNMLTRLGDGELCDLVGICTETNVKVQASYSVEAVSGVNGASVECEFCEKVIQHWVDVWTANTTENEFKEVLEALCHKLGSGDRVDSCLKVVDEYYLPWFNYLLHNINPEVICNAIGLCGPGEFMKVDERFPVWVLLPPKDVSGAQVLLGMTTLEPAIRWTGQDKQNAEVTSTQLNPSQGLIGGFFEPQTAMTVKKPTCAICEFTMRKIDAMLKDNRTAEAIEKTVAKACNILPSGVQDQCYNLMDIYSPALIRLLKRGIDPSTVCARLDLCPDRLLMLVAADDANAPRDNPVIAARKSSQGCAMCEMVFDTVYSMLNDSTNQHEVQNVLDTICYHLPSSVSEECERLVEKYTVPALDLILQAVTADEICAKLKLCQEPPPNKKGPSKKCVLCEYIVTTLDKMVTDRHNEEQVRIALDRLCGYLPKTLSGECVKFVDQYSSMIIDLFANDLTPDEVCRGLRLCTDEGLDIQVLTNNIYSPTRPEVSPKQEVQGERPYCLLCEYAIGEVDKILTDKKDEDEIKHILDEICYKLTAPVKKECLLMVNKYTDQIIDMFVSEYTPGEICTELRLCKKQAPTHFISNEIPPLPSQNSLVVEEEEPRQEDEGLEQGGQGPLCVLCEFAISVLDRQILLANRTLDMVERGVELVCSYLPRSVEQGCDDFVDEYGDQIIQLLVQAEMDPKEVCTELQLCKSTGGLYDASPVGGHRCAWGPDYWCQSLFHAHACGTTSRCKKHVWGTSKKHVWRTGN